MICFIFSIANGSGNLIHVNNYDEYGIPGAGNVGRFQYTGQAWIPELGMYYYKARIYSPSLGRFMQTDPVGYKDQINLYAYVGNDPINVTDPTGQRCDSAAGLTTCTPENASWSPFTFPTPAGWEDFDSHSWFFHKYSFTTYVGSGNKEYGDTLRSQLIQHPAPNAEQPASFEGSLENVKLFGISGDDQVLSYKKRDPDNTYSVVTSRLRTTPWDPGL